MTDMRILAALLLAAAVLTGCGSDATTDSDTVANDSSTPTASQEATTPSAKPDPEAKPASGPELSTAGLSCSVPKGWADTSGDAPAGVILSAADLRDADDNPAMISVSKLERGPSSIKAAEARSSATLTSGGATHIVVEDPLEIGGHDASHVRGVTEDAGAHYRVDQYVVPTDDAAWVIRISTNQYLTDDYRDRTVDSILVSCQI